jgi:uncharacterized membrane protein
MPRAWRPGGALMLQPLAPSGSVAPPPQRVRAGGGRGRGAGALGLFVLKRIGWGIMVVLVAVFVVRESRYFTLDPAVYFAPQRLVYVAHTGAIITHIAASMVALVVGPLQFLARLRKKRALAVHRWLGRAYLLGVLVGSGTGFYMAWLSYGGLPAHLSFATLATWWFVTGLVAYRHIRAGRIEAHRRWMLRNYALTFAAVTLRLWLVLLIFPLGVPYEEAFVTVSWICWVWNLAAAEWLIHRRRTPPAGRGAVRPPAPRPAAA